MRAIIYLRVSTDDQSLGIEAQRKACLQYCLNRGISIAGEFSDEGVSGSLMPKDRPALTEALNCLKKGDILLVAKRDRIARFDKALHAIKEKTEDKKAKIISAIDEGTWTENKDDPMAYMMRLMADGFAEFERLTIKTRTIAALAVKKAKGERTGHIPFGYHLANDGIHLEIDENEQNIIRLMRKLHESGMSVRNIADELNKQGLFNRSEKPWSKSACHRILNQKAA
jgi:DNA invertase Pin-like site-specific DNA recombinase